MGNKKKVKNNVSNRDLGQKRVKYNSQKFWGNAKGGEIFSWFIQKMRNGASFKLPRFRFKKLVFEV